MTKTGWSVEQGRHTLPAKPDKSQLVKILELHTQTMENSQSNLVPSRLLAPQAAFQGLGRGRVIVHGEIQTAVASTAGRALDFTLPNNTAILSQGAGASGGSGANPPACQ